VLLPFGTPAPGATVYFVKISDDIRKEYLDGDDFINFPFDIYETQTDSNGLFRMDNLKPDQYLVHAESKGYASVHCEIDTGKDWPDKIELMLGREKRIYGKVVNINNDPMVGVLVEVSLPYLPWSNLYSIPAGDAIDLLRFHGIQKTDENGHFDIGGQSMATLVLTIDGGPVEGYAPVFRRIPYTYEAEHIIVMRKVCTLEGKVTDANGKPIQNALLYDLVFENGGMSIGDCVSTGEDGEYKFEQTREGSLFLDIKHPDYGNVSRFVDVSAGTHNRCDISLPYGITKLIAVTDSDQNPLEKITIHIVDIDTGVTCQNAITDINGHVHANSLICGNMIKISARPEWENKNNDRCFLYHTVEDDSDITIQLPNKKPGILFNVYDKETKALIKNFNTYLLGGEQYRRRGPA